MEQTGKAEQSATARSFVIAQTTIAARPLEPALYLVATPIGNLSDITIRALETLAGADIVACEDTRVTRVLLDRYGIRQRPTPYHEHNADVAGPRLVAALGAGKSVALVSDAGTPLVSDPGYRLVERALAAGIRVVPIPGASAVLAALTASGLPSDTFLFGGFLPSKGGQLRSRLEALKSTEATLIFFESPRRLAATLDAMEAVLRKRPPGGGGQGTDQDLRGIAARHARRACRALSRGRGAEGRSRHLRRAAGSGERRGA